ALSGPLVASSSLGYSLTSTSAAGAQIAPLFGKVLTAQDVDTTVGSGVPPLNKGVDIGDTFFVPAGPIGTLTSTYSASHPLTGNPAYDLMSATLAFSLSANSNVGLSGFVSQEVDPVPEPNAWMLVVAGGALVLFGLRRRA